jgi:hypothetical protein
VSTDGGIVICMRKAGGSVKPTLNGGWLHRLQNFDRRPNFTRPPVPAARVTHLADIERRAGVYAALVRDYLTLATEHRENLLARGMSEAEINRNGYASLPSAVHGTSVANALLHLGLDGVPGFYRDGQTWHMNVYGSGYLVPVRDEHSRIQAFQIRRDEGEPRYMWFSTNPEKFIDGTSSGAPVHFAKPQLLRDANEVTITEGALKADAIAYLTQAPVIGVAGVGNFGSDFASRLRESFPRLHRAVIAYDRDLLEKEQVYSALMRLTAQLEDALFRVRIRTWPHPAKGYDDFLLSQLVRQEVGA